MKNMDDLQSLFGSNDIGNLPVPPKESFAGKLKKLLSTLQQGGANLMTGGLDTSAAPDPNDVMAAGIEANPHPQGFAQQIAEVARKRGSARLGVRQAAQGAIDTDLKRQSTRADITATEALAGQRDSTADLNKSKVAAQTIKNTLDSATTQPQIDLIKGRVALLKEQAQEAQAHAQEMISNAKLRGDQSAQLKWQQQFDTAKEAFDQFVDLEKVDIAKREASIKEQELPSKINLNTSSANENNAQAGLAGAQAIKTTGEATGSTAGGAAAIDKTRSEADRNRATAAASIDNSALKDVNAVLTQAINLKKLGYGKDVIEAALQQKQQEGILPAGLDFHQPSFWEKVDSAFGGTATKPAVQPVATPAPKAAPAAGGTASPKVAIGQTVVIGNKRIRITKVFPDGSFDGDEVK